MDITQFIFHTSFAVPGGTLPTWVLFVALIIVVAVLATGPILQLMHRVQKVGPSEAVMLINRQHGVVVDVRDAKDFQTGHITQAVNLPFGELKARVGELDKYKKRPLIVSCRAGDRAAKGAILLRKHGFENVAVLAGGMNAWERSQLPVAK